MRDSGFKVFKIFGIEIFIDYSWLFIFLIIFWVFTVNYYPTLFPDFSPTADVALGAITSILFFTSALVHEIAHSLVSIKNGVPVRRITLFLFGGIAELFDEPEEAAKEFKIALAGPAMSLFLAILFYVLGYLFQKSHLLSVYALFNTLFQVNAILAAFNLLPGFPLDGGRILRSIYWYYTKDLTRSTKVATTGGQLVAYLLIGFGVFQIIVSGFISGIWLILIGLFLNQSAKQSFLEMIISNELKDKKISSLMRRNIISVHPQLSINELLTEYFLRYHALSFPVVEDHNIIGLVSLKDIQKKSSEELQVSRVRNLMKRFPIGMCLGPEDRLLSALKIMLKEDVNFVPVKELGEIRGLITLEDIADYLESKKIV